MPLGAPYAVPYDVAEARTLPREQWGPSPDERWSEVRSDWLREVETDV